MLTKRLISYNDFFTLAWRCEIQCSVVLCSWLFRRPVAVLSSEEMVVLFIQYIFSLPGLLSSIDKKVSFVYATFDFCSEF